MANGVYDKARESFLGQSPAIAWGTDTIKVALVRGYTPNTATHQYLSDVTGGGGTLVSTATLGTKTTTAGVADAADVTFPAVPLGSACSTLVVYKDTGAAGTSPLIAVIDTATGLPVTPNGGDVVVPWDNASNRIFKL